MKVLGFLEDGIWGLGLERLEMVEEGEKEIVVEIFGEGLERGGEGGGGEF